MVLPVTAEEQQSGPERPAAGTGREAAGERGGPAAAGERGGPAAVVAAGPRWASRLDTGLVLYGTIVSAAALAVGAGRGDTAYGMTETMVITLLVYYLAHIYIVTVGQRLPGGAVPLHRLIWTAARSQSAILVGGLPAVTVAVIMSISHVALWVTVLSDLATAIVVLALDGLLAGLHAGVRGWRLGVEAASAAVLGGVIALLLVSLHRH